MKNPAWVGIRETACAALVPHGRMVALGECPTGPFQFDGDQIGWMTEYSCESYLVSGEHCCIDKATHVQPLLIVGYKVTK